MALQEYETTEFIEMVYLGFTGFPYEFDRENPKRVKAIFRGDVDLMKGLLEKFWAGEKENISPIRFLNFSSEMKRSLWVGGKYDPSFHKR